MAFCSNCGTQIADGSTTCAACASRIPAAPAAAVGNVGGMADNVAGMLAYFTIIPAIIFLVLEPYNKSRFVRFHAWQCLFFAIAWTVLWIAQHCCPYSYPGLAYDPDLASGRARRSGRLDHSCDQGERRTDVQVAGDRRSGGKASQRDVDFVTLASSSACAHELAGPSFVLLRVLCG